MKKKIQTSILLFSFGFNVFFLYRKIKYLERQQEENALHVYKKISHKEGYNYFQKQIKKNYPQTNLNNKYFIVYMWDSLMYEFMYRDQMKVLDSMASSFGKYKFEYIFATEMEERASKSFLKRSYDEYTNVKMLFGMDDFISGLYSINYIKLNMPKEIHLNQVKNKTQIPQDDVSNFKQKILYLVMDSEGKILFTNQKKYMVTKDTAFLNKLDNLLPAKNLKILN
jgi:hypothetical protein